MGHTARGRVVIVSGPSGAGKTTVLRGVFQRACVPLVASVSATTRQPRPGERDGVDYHFLSNGEFAARRAGGEFLESFEVFGKGCWYGTLRSEVDAGLAAGKWVVLEIDVQGALVVMQQYADAISIFLCPSSPAELAHRLRKRGTESEEVVARRLAQAEQELTFANRYRHRVANDDVEQAVSEICGILKAYSETDQT